ncbi:hypothetical protein HYT33_04175 [Candidatus Roizmanbacteria bacterium]|nr:hypothetical protein [Candidatus Roizmanbacteria bacterium]
MERLRIPAPEEETHHNCALVGIVLDSPAPLHNIIRNGLLAQQNRGQEAAGMVWSEDGQLQLQKGLSLVTSVFPPNDKAAFSHLGIGHTRYSTVNKENPEEELKKSQPFIFKNGPIEFAIAHNGTVYFDYSLSEGEPDSDTYKVGKAISEGKGSFEQNAIDILSRVEGAYTFLFATPDGLYVARDPTGFRPCVIGELDNGLSGFVVASESIGLEKLGAHAREFDRELARGEFIKIRPDGFDRLWKDPRRNERQEAVCTFEHAYFAGHESFAYDNVTNDEVRGSLGRRLAERVMPEGDVVFGVPMSGLLYAEGVSKETGIPKEEGIHANRYELKNFIKPLAPEERMEHTKYKYSFIPNKIRGRRIVLVDDSIVRGHTMQGIILKLFDLEAKEIHLLVGIPPIVAPCYWGIDFKHANELVYHELMNDETRTGSFEERLAMSLVADDKQLASRLRVSFQNLDDYVSIVKHVSYGTPLESSGGCFHCVSAIPPKGVSIPELHDVPVKTLFKASV